MAKYLAICSKGRAWGGPGGPERAKSAVQHGNLKISKLGTPNTTS